MITRRNTRKANHRQKRVQKGGSIIDDFISNLPFEAHLLDFGTHGVRRYCFCGPGTKLNNRTSGPPDYFIKPHSQPINGLDKACYYHDIAYDKYKDTASRNIADQQLYNRALEWERQMGSNLSTADKINLGIVKTVMSGKVKHGVGVGKKKLAM